MVAWESSKRRLSVWIMRVSGGDPVGRRRGERPPLMNVGEPGEWTHGWQFWASSISDTFFRRALLSNRTAARQAHLTSHYGRNAGAALAFAPTALEFTIAPYLFRVLVLERLHLPLPITEAVCEGCGAPVDIRGHHRAASMRTGRMKKRALPRSWSAGPIQCVPPRHECRSARH